MSIRRLAASLFAMFLALSSVGLSGAAAAETAAELPYEYAVSQTLGTQTETISMYDYEADAAKDVELEFVLVPNGAELSVTPTIDLGAYVTTPFEEDGVYTEWMPYYWNVDGNMSGLNFIEKDTTATVTFKYDEASANVYRFDVWDEGLERTVYFRVLPEGADGEANDGEEQPAAPATEVPVEVTKTTAVPTTSKVLVNGEPVDFESYNIDGSNYFKLRDIAAAVTDSEKQFEVGWDAANNAISLESGQAYTLAGGELEKSGQSADQEAVTTSSRIYLDGEQIQLQAYNINDNNYFKLRDLAKALNIGITWDADTNTIGIDTAIDYEEE